MHVAHAFWRVHFCPRILASASPKLVFLHKCVTCSRQLCAGMHMIFASALAGTCSRWLLATWGLSRTPSPPSRAARCLPAFAHCKISLVRRLAAKMPQTAKMLQTANMYTQLECQRKCSRQTGVEHRRADARAFCVGRSRWRSSQSTTRWTNWWVSPPESAPGESRCAG